MPCRPSLPAGFAEAILAVARLKKSAQELSKQKPEDLSENDTDKEAEGRKEEEKSTAARTEAAALFSSRLEQRRKTQQEHSQRKVEENKRKLEEVTHEREHSDAPAALHTKEAGWQADELLVDLQELCESVDEQVCEDDSFQVTAADEDEFLRRPSIPVSEKSSLASPRAVEQFFRTVEEFFRNVDPQAVKDSEFAAAEQCRLADERQQQLDHLKKAEKDKDEACKQQRDKVDRERPSSPSAGLYSDHLQERDESLIQGNRLVHNRLIATENPDSLRANTERRALDLIAKADNTRAANIKLIEDRRVIAEHARRVEQSTAARQDAERAELRRRTMDAVVQQGVVKTQALLRGNLARKKTAEIRKQQEDRDLDKGVAKTQASFGGMQVNHTWILNASCILMSKCTTGHTLIPLKKSPSSALTWLSPSPSLFLFLHTHTLTHSLTPAHTHPPLSRTHIRRASRDELH